MLAGIGPQQALHFGPFRLLCGERLLLEGDQPVRIGGRAMDLLVALTQRAGQVVSKEALLSIVWPDNVVEEASLRVHIASLRKVLGDGQGGARYIANVPGRGYSFVAVVSQAPMAARSAGEVAAAVAAAVPDHNLPVRLTRMVGRQRAVQAVVAQLQQHRLVTIAGPGGMGKTTLALAVAEQLLGRYAHGVRFVDLAVLSDAQLVPGAVASALGLSPDASSALANLGHHLKERQMLIVLDNCEHVIDAAAALAVMLLKGAAQLSILATGREPLRAEGESVHRLAALVCPPAEPPELSAGQALQYPAVQLLVERVAASMDDYQLSDADAALAAQLCRRLDGLPLAIELAAGRVGIFGLRQLVARLDASLKLLSSGQRTVLPRHQTLKALLDWSYQLLSPAGQAVLRRLAVFAGGFTLEAAAVVAQGSGLGEEDVLEQVSELVGKSLVATDLNGDDVRYRLLDTTRSYAADQLQQSGEKDETARRHLQQVLAQLQRANDAWDASGRAQWLARHGALIDEVRVALDWAFSSDGGDVVLGATLTSSCVLLAHRLSMLDAQRARIEQALARLASASPRQPMLELQLNSVLGALLAQTDGSLSDVGAASARAIRAAEAVGWERCNADALIGLWVGHFGRGDYDGALRLLDRVSAIARRDADPRVALNADRLLASTEHYLGRHEKARTLALRVLHDPLELPKANGNAPAPFDRRISMGIVLARIYWIEGRADDALALARSTLQHAESEVAFAQCHVLAFAACPIALWRGDVPEATEWIDMLDFVAAAHSLRHWKNWARNFKRVGSGEAAPEIPADDIKQWDLFATLGAVPPHARTIARVDEGTLGWCAPEVLRVQAERRQLGGASDDHQVAEALYRRSLAMAAAQGALAWEVRTATSWARLLRARGQRVLAQRLLAPAVERVNQGLNAKDTQAARELLLSLA